MVDISSAIKAYGQFAKMGSSPSLGSAQPKMFSQSSGGGVAGGSGGAFSDLLKSSMNNVVEQGQNAEQMSQKLIAGEADLLDVTNAVNNMEVTLQTVIAIRDKVLTAYQEIMRMPI
ncbi:MAG: flagellar hook-basal body complex protein FliE [Alphaproteobacteria bacterium]